MINSLDITLDDIKGYLRINIDDIEDDSLLELIIIAAKGYILSYTGLKEIEANKISELRIAMYIVCSDMYENRKTTSDKAKENNTLNIILNMHSKNGVF